MSDTTTKEPKADLLPVAIKTKQALYKAYMPFVKNGGLFVATNKPYQCGESVILLLTLLEEPEKQAVKGTIVWKTPPGAEGGRLVGIGVQFNPDSAKDLCKRIETYLSGMPSTGERHTF